MLSAPSAQPENFDVESDSVTDPSDFAMPADSGSYGAEIHAESDNGSHITQEISLSQDGAEENQSEPLKLIADSADNFRARAILEKGGVSNTACSDEIIKEAVALAERAREVMAGKKEEGFNPEYASKIIEALSAATNIHIHRKQTLGNFCARVIEVDNRRKIGSLSEFLIEARELKIMYEREQIGSLLNPDSNVMDIYLKTESFINRLAAKMKSVSETDINIFNANQIATILESMTGIRWSGEKFIQYVLRVKQAYAINTRRKRTAVLVNLHRAESPQA